MISSPSKYLDRADNNTVAIRDFAWQLPPCVPRPLTEIQLLPCVCHSHFANGGALAIGFGDNHGDNALALGQNNAAYTTEVRPVSRTASSLKRGFTVAGKQQNVIGAIGN